MTILYYEYELLKHMRELEARDRRLEHWGWYRRHETGPLPAEWRLRVGRALIHLGCWLEGREHAEALGGSGKS